MDAVGAQDPERNDQVVVAGETLTVKLTVEVGTDPVDGGSYP